MTTRTTELALRTGASCDFDAHHLLAVFAEQRQQFIEVLETFGSDDWIAPTRCAEWSAHDVVRHLCDCNAVATGTHDTSLDVTGGFDPRTTPRRWMKGSAKESPDATLDRLADTTDALLELARFRLMQGESFEVALPYGSMDWTVLMLHAFWDSWIHERDVLLMRGAAHPSSDAATFYATSYGLFLAANVAVMFGAGVLERLTLGGDGGGSFDLDGRGGAVTLMAQRRAETGPQAADFTDALAGRTTLADVYVDLPVESCGALSYLADFFNSPVEQGMRP